jgi:hypothetical protein
VAAWGSAGQRGTGGGIATMWGSAATAALVAGGSGGAETRGWFYDGRGLEENGDWKNLRLRVCTPGRRWWINAAMTP